MKVCIVTEFDQQDFFQWTIALNMFSKHEIYSITMNQDTLKFHGENGKYWDPLRAADIVFVYCVRHDQNWKWYELPLIAKKFMRPDAKMICQFDLEFMWLFNKGNHPWKAEPPWLKDKTPEEFFSENKDVINIADAYIVFFNPELTKFISKPIYPIPLPQLIRYTNFLIDVPTREDLTKKTGRVAIIKHSVQSADEEHTLKNVIIPLEYPISMFTCRHTGSSEKLEILKDIPKRGESEVYGLIGRDAFMEFLSKCRIAIDDNEGYRGWSRFVVECALAHVPCIGSTLAVKEFFPRLYTEHKDYETQKKLLERLQNDKDFWLEMATEGKNNVIKKLDTERLVHKFESLIEELTQNKIKISILEFDLSSFGGRHIELVDGFLDSLKEMDINVKIYGQFSKILLKSKEELVQKSVGRVTENDIILFKSLSEILNELSESDMILSVAHYPELANYVKVPVVHWIIAKPSSDMIPVSKLIWTNSHHQRKEIGMDAEVIYSPLDYSLWRQRAKPWKERKIDILVVTGVTKMKIDKYFLGNELKVLEKLNEKMHVVGIFPVRNEKERLFVESLKFETHINLDRKEISKFMGNAKIFLNPSPIECAALVIYEALNAGCFPVVRRAGSCEEQMGEIGIIYDTSLEDVNDEFWIRICNTLKGEHDINLSVQQGLKFDRMNSKQRLIELINKVINKEIPKPLNICAPTKLENKQDDNMEKTSKDDLSEEYKNFVKKHFPQSIPKRPCEGERIHDSILKEFLTQDDWDAIYGRWRAFIEGKEPIKEPVKEESKSVKIQEQPRLPKKIIQPILYPKESNWFDWDIKRFPMERFPKVTVIIPVKNRSRIIRRCLDGVLAEKYPNLEILVIDGGSIDGTLEIIREYQKKHPEIICDSREDKNVGEARNRGLKLATGDYITYADADDETLIGKFQLLASFLEANPRYFAVFGRMLPKSPDGEISGPTLVPNIVNFETLKQGNYIGVDSIMFRNEPDIMIDENAEYGEDYKLWLMIMKKYNVAFITKNVYIWNWGQHDSITTKIWRLGGETYRLAHIESAKRIKEVEDYFTNGPYNEDMSIAVFCDPFGHHPYGGPAIYGYNICEMLYRGRMSFRRVYKLKHICMKCCREYDCHMADCDKPKYYGLCEWCRTPFPYRFEAHG